jgi:hypothetical protein
MKELPIACELTPAELQARREGLLPGLLALARESVPVVNGRRWRFAPSAEFLNEAVKVIDAERQCCRFLKFVLAVEQDGGDMWLEVTGPEGTAQFLEMLTKE